MSSGRSHTSTTRRETMRPCSGKSFASKPAPQQITIATIIKAAKDSGFDFGATVRALSADPASNNELEAAIDRLSAMTPLDYDRVRKSEAEKLGVRLSTLDEAVERRRPRTEDLGDESISGQGQAITFPTIETWPSPVDGVELLDEIEAAYKRYAVMPDEGIVAAALWSIFTHCYEEFEHSPRLALQSPEPRCGKTTVLKITERLVNRALRADNVTAAALFRMIERYAPTILVDEADAFAKENEELRGIINSGHERGGAVIRTVGEDFEPRQFKTWAPMLISGIGGLAGTIEDRSIIVRLQRKRGDEQVERLCSNTCGHLHDLARKIVRWLKDQPGAFRDADPPIPDQLGDRAADNWRPLLAIADEAGGRWPDAGKERSYRPFE